MAGAHLTNEQVEEIRKLRNQNYSSKEIADIIGCANSTVNIKIRELGLEPINSRSRLTGEQISKIRELSEKDYTSQQIAAIIKCSKETVRRIRVERGFKKCTKYAPISQDKIDNILRLSIERYTQQEIADRVGVSKDTVQRYQRLNELPASNRSEPSGKRLRADYIAKLNNKKEKEDMKNAVQSATDIKDQNVVSMPEKKEENAMQKIVNTECVNLMDAAVRFSGNKTCYDYSIKIFDGNLVVDFGGGYNISIPFNQIANFSNELMDVASKIELMRKGFATA